MNYFAFSALVNGLASLLLGFYALVKGSQNALNKNYAFFAFSVFFWSFGYFFWQIATDAAGALFWCRVFMAGAILIPVAYFNFSLWLTDKYHENRLQSYFSYFLGGAFLLLNFTPLIVEGITKKLYFEFWPTPGAAYPLFLLMFFFYALYSLYIMYTVFRTASGHLRAQIMYVFLGTAIGYAGGSTNFLLWYDIPVPPIANILVLAYPLLLAYAITKHRLMDISVVISRTIAEILAILFHAVIYLTLVYLYRTFLSEKIDLLFLALTVSYGILVAETHHVLRLFFQTTSDKLFLRGKYDYYKALSDASSRVGEKLSLPDILKVLYETFHNVVEISSPRVYLPENFAEPHKTSEFYVVYEKDTYLPQKDGQKVKIDSPLVKELIAKREPLCEVKETSSAIVVPCLLEDRLIAFFALGPKLSEDPYTDQDLRLLKVLANQVAITLDHTRSYEKIKVDLEVAERQLERSQRLASLGTLTAGVTHEIRNPLTVIRAETERLANQARELDYLKQYRDLMLKHIDRIAGIVQRMLGLAKEKEKREVDIDLNEVIDSTLQCFTISRVGLKKELQPIPPVKGDPEEFQEIFVNLIQNALDAMPDGGDLTLRTYKDDGHVVAEVSDTGKGIPEEIREKIFDPFYSTRHEGVGLGLSIVYRIVRQHGGDIKVESEVGKGTTFKLIF
ncbi:MAG: ATP-binding protein [Candidatus Margulisbacteria bacterium]|nr:ATP-binding protein [Candidatus Margulisiibacteriota bacterium]